MPHLGKAHPIPPRINTLIFTQDFKYKHGKNELLLLVLHEIKY